MVSAFRLFVHPNGDTSARAVEFSITLLVDRHLSLLPTKDIGPHLTLVLGSDVHFDLARTGVAHQAGESIFPVMGAATNETDAVGVVPVIILFAVGVQFACQSNVCKLVSTRRRLLVLALDSVQITVEDARVAIAAEKDQGVCQWLEEAFYRSCDRLAFLRVVVLDDRLADISEGRDISYRYDLPQRSRAWP